MRGPDTAKEVTAEAHLGRQHSLDALHRKILGLAPRDFIACYSRTSNLKG